MKNGKISWKSFKRWEKKIFKNRESGFMLRSVNNANSPIGPGSLTEDDFLYYIEAYCTVMGVYYWNFSNVLSYRVMMDEFWNLREKIYKFNKLRNDDEIFKKIKKATFKDLGNVDEKELDGWSNSAPALYLRQLLARAAGRDITIDDFCPNGEDALFIYNNLVGVYELIKENFVITFNDGIDTAFFSE